MANISVDKESIKNFCSRWSISELAIFGPVLREDFQAGSDREEFLSDIKSQDSVIRRLEIIGKAAMRISEETRKAYPSLPWKEMIGTRNFLIHDYADVDIQIVWKTVKNDLPDLLDKMKNARLFLIFHSSCPNITGVSVHHTATIMALPRQSVHYPYSTI